MLLVSLLVVYTMQHAIGMIPASIKTEKQGNFKIRAARYEGFGHSYTREDLYYRRELIARGIGQVQLDPGDGDRMLFSLPFPDKLAAGTYYYDGRRKQLFRIDPGLLFYTKEKGNERLSPGGAYLVADIEPEYKASEGVDSAGIDLVLVELETGKALDVRKTIRDEFGGHPEVEFRGWQGAGEEFVVEAQQRVESENWKSTRYAVRADSGKLRQVDE